MDGMYTITCKALPDGGTKCTEKTQGEGLDEGQLLVLTQRSVAQLELIKPLEAELEDTRAVFFMHDGPWQFVGHDYVSSTSSIPRLTRVEAAVGGVSRVRRVRHEGGARRA